MSRLAIIVLTWNNADDSIECITSLLSQTKKDFTILSIDNKSTDNSKDRLINFINSEENENIVFIAHGKNDGTAGGFNVGIKWAIENDYDYIGTLNADAKADPKWVKSLYDEIDGHNDTGIVTGMTLRSNGKTIDTTGDYYTTWGIPGPRLRDAPAEKAPKKAEYIFGCSGGAFLARTAMFRDIGLFDERYFMYYEDVDISFRAQLAGWKARYTPSAIAYHKLGASSKTVPGLATYNTFKNLPMLFTKNVPLRLCLSMYPRFVLAYTLILGNAIARGRGLPALKGYFTSWRNLIHMFRERNRIQKNRKVSIEYIDSIILHDIPPEQTGMRKFRQFFTGKP